jgi:thiamine kinase-like enzyme
LINNEFDKAEICKEQIKSLLSSHKVKSIAGELPTLKNITEALNKKGFQIAKINMIKKIDKGSSNFGKYLVEVIIKDTFITLFAVIKLPDKSHIHKQNDLLREAAGFQMLKKNWRNLIEKHLPKQVMLLSTAESDVLFSYYAEESKTNQVKTLIASMETDFNRTLAILDQIRAMYKEKHSSLSMEHKRNRSIYLHIKETVSEKWQDILNLNWEEFGIDPKKRYIQLQGKLFPNVIFFLQNKKKWNEKSISLNYDVLHGDLNPENCMITSTGNFVFIDFEKVGEKPFFYDLSFLTVWILQHFALEKNIQIESILQIQECVYEFIYQFDKTVSVSSQLANVYSILQNLLPVREHLEENEQIGFDIALLCAFIQRAFYELRDSAKEERKLHVRNGLFFYAFSCFLLHQYDFVNVSNAKINNAFDFPFPAKK